MSLGAQLGEAAGTKERRTRFEPHEAIARMRCLQRAQMLQVDGGEAVVENTLRVAPALPEQGGK